MDGAGRAGLGDDHVVRPRDARWSRFVDGAGVGIGAAILGVPLAIPLGILVFLGAFVPIVGALVSGSVAVLVAFVAVGPVKALLMLGGRHPRPAGRVARPAAVPARPRGPVHPLAVIFAIAAGVLLAGIVGALFAVPFVAVRQRRGQLPGRQRRRRGATAGGRVRGPTAPADDQADERLAGEVDEVTR